MNDDIRDLLGRYATGSLSPEEQKRLFEAALDDQELFDEVAREQDLKQLIDEPGARLRLIRALEPPSRKSGWIFGIAATVAFTIVVVAILYRPAPKPEPQVAKVPVFPSSVLEHAVPETPQPAPPPPKAVGTVDRKTLNPKTTPGAAKQKVQTASQPVDAPNRDEPKKDVAVAQTSTPSPPPSAAVPSSSQAVEVQAAASVLEQEAAPQQSRLIAPQANARAGGAGGAVRAPAIGFHYSLDNPGHLTIIPLNDGFLSVKTADGKDVYALHPAAAGILIDIPLPTDATSVNVTFSDTNNPVASTPVPQTSISGDVQGPGSAAIQLKVKQ